MLPKSAAAWEASSGFWLAVARIVFLIWRDLSGFWFMDCIAAMAWVSAAAAEGVRVLLVDEGVLGGLRLAAAGVTVATPLGPLKGLPLNWSTKDGAGLGGL